MRYTLQDYSDVLFTGYKYELPEKTQNIIVNLTKELGVVIAAAMAASTVSHQQDDDFKRQGFHHNKRSKSGRFTKESLRDSRLGSEGTPTEPPGGAKRQFSIDSLRTTCGGSRLQYLLADPNGLSTENDSRFKQRNERSDESWKGAPAFKATKIEKKEGADLLMNEIRVCLNKISNKNYEQQRDAICKCIQEVLEEQDEEVQLKNVKMIAQSIFDIASSNKFYSEIYAGLYRELIEKYVFFSDYISNVITEYYEGIDKIEFVDSNKDYDKYCENNKLNDKRKAMSTFIVNLMRQQVLPKNEVLDLIISIQNKIIENIDAEDKTNWIDEVTENLYILISLVAQDQDTNGGSIEEQVIKIRNNVELCSKFKVKDHKSVSSRAIFKYMDILELI
jgi:hypothetical protein